ncbi:MAG: hypothetical protein ACXABY_24465 [Candidatus Thorarchaeota archaeon]
MGESITAQAASEAPQWLYFGAGPITDRLGSLWDDNAATEDWQGLSFINCARPVTVAGTAGTWLLDALTQSGNAVHVRNETDGAVTFQTSDGSFSTEEDLDSGTTTHENTVTITINVTDAAGDNIANAQTAVYLTSDRTQLMNEDTVAGVATEAYNYTGDVEVEVRVRKGSTGATKYIPDSRISTITGDGLTENFRLIEDTNNAS